MKVNSSDMDRFFEKHATETSMAAYDILMCWYLTNEDKKEAYKFLRKEFKKARLTLLFSEQVEFWV